MQDCQAVLSGAGAVLHTYVRCHLGLHAGGIMEPGKLPPQPADAHLILRAQQLRCTTHQPPDLWTSK